MYVSSNIQNRWRQQIPIVFKLALLTQNTRYKKAIDSSASCFSRSPHFIAIQLFWHYLSCTSFLHMSSCECMEYTLNVMFSVAWPRTACSQKNLSGDVTAYKATKAFGRGGLLACSNWKVWHKPLRVEEGTKRIVEGQWESEARFGYGRGKRVVSEMRKSRCGTVLPVFLGE